MTALAKSSPAARSPMMEVDEVGKVLKASPWTVRQLIRRKELRAIRLTSGRRAPYRVAQDDLDAFIAARSAS